MSSKADIPTDPDEMTKQEKSALLQRLADRFRDEDPELSEFLELASQASLEESN